MDEPVSVLHVVDCLNVGGTERQMFELIRRLDRRRFRPLVACFKAKGELLPSLHELGIEPVPFPLGGSLARPGTALTIARMALHCRRENVRIVHSHDFYSNVIGVAAAKMAGLFAIASRRDLGHWLSSVQRRALRLALRMADCTIANAEAVGELVVREEGLPREKLRVVPNGIDVPLFDRRSARQPEPPLPPLDDELPRVVMVASMHLPDKGHSDLLHAAALLRSRGRRAQWLIVSDGVLRASLEQQSRDLGLESDVHFLGRRVDVAAIIGRADLVVHPSWAEGFPNVVMEAMCAGKAVVATRVGGCPELVTDGVNGLLLEPRRPDVLADKIESLLADSLCARTMGVRGRQIAEERYSLERMTATVEQIYSSLTGAGALAAA